MEERIALRLQQAGVAFQSGREFCVARTTPDFFLPKQFIAVYLDGQAVHKGKRLDRDDFLRGQLTKHTGIKVLPIPYSGNSKRTEDSIVEQILERVS